MPEITGPVRLDREGRFNVLNSELETKLTFSAIVRLGWQGELACVEVSPTSPTENDDQGLSADRFRRGDRVVVELVTGQQVAEYVTESKSSLTVSGRLLRLMEPNDELRFGHLELFAQQSLEKYNASLTAHEQQFSLLDVEPLMDGATLLLHFLQPNVPAEYTSRILKFYEEQARTSEFFQKVERGCGPDCGTKSAQNGCSTCVNCSVRCFPKRVRQ